MSIVEWHAWHGIAGGALRGDHRGARLVVLHQRAHGVLGGLLRLPQARGALPGCYLQHPSTGETRQDDRHIMSLSSTLPYVFTRLMLAAV